MLKALINRYSLILTFIVFYSTQSVILAQSDSLVHSVFLIGDAGEPVTNPVLTLLKSEAQKYGKKASVVFLGDNIYPKGLPPKGHPLRKEAEISN